MERSPPAPAAASCRCGGVFSSAFTLIMDTVGGVFWAAYGLVLITQSLNLHMQIGT
jgi:hypothetical protein